MSDQVFALLFNLFVTAVVARYLGPSSFGLLSYTFALAAILGVFGQLGLDGLVVRELAHPHAEQQKILGTVFVLKLTAYFLSACALAGLSFVLTTDETERQLLWVSAAYLATLPLLTTNHWFHAQVQSRYYAIANSSGTLIAGAVKLGAVAASLSVVVIAVTNVLQTAVTALIAYYLFVRQSASNMFAWRFCRKVARTLLSEGWSIALAGLLAAIYLKIDQAMLKWLSTTEVVGIYSVAAKLSEATYFVPAAVMVSVFPRLIGIKDEGEEKFQASLQIMFDIMVMVALVIVLGILIGAQLAIPLIFGSDYSDAGPVLMVHALALPLIFVRTVFTRWILIERFSIFLLFSDGVGAFANIGLNLLLIPHFGAMGAAIATVISYAAASYVSLAGHSRTRPLFLMITRSLFLPWRALDRIRLQLL